MTGSNSTYKTKISSFKLKVTVGNCKGDKDRASGTLFEPAEVHSKFKILYQRGINEWMFNSWFPFYDFNYEIKENKLNRKKWEYWFDFEYNLERISFYVLRVTVFNTRQETFVGSPFLWLWHNDIRTR